MKQFTELAKGCPAKDCIGACGMQEQQGKYDIIHGKECTENTCPVWHFIKQLQGEKSDEDKMP